MPHSISLTVICLATCFLVRTHGQCTSWPSMFASSTWLDSAYGTLVFSTNTMSGYTVNSYADVSHWTCMDETSFDTDGRLLFRSTSTMSGLGGDWYVYVCMKLTKITDSSYTYYLQTGQEPNAGEHRVRVIPDTNMVGLADVCNEGAGSSGSEFNTLVNQGSASSAYITCPSVLLGRFEFNYTDSSDVEHCNDPGYVEHMNVCTDKTKLDFFVPCAGQSIVYADAEVYCVASVTVGTDTFVQLYNPQTTVDDSTTYRFSCMAITETSLSATVVYNNCTADMSSSERAVDYGGIVIGATIDFYPYEGGCPWPTAFASSTWQDNTRGDLVFTATDMSGWGMNIQSQQINNWECLDTQYFDTQGILLLKSIDTFTHLGTTWISYLCLEMTKVSDYSYTYYQKHQQDSVGAEERVKFSNDGSLTAKTDICATVTVPTAEFHFILKSGQASAAKQFCPPSLLAKMDYTHTSDTNALTCDNSVDDWDVCTDRTIMTFNYTTCGTEMAYSASGEVYCMVNLTSTYEYVVVFNTDGAPTYTFACFVINSAGTAASMVYNNCTENQIPTDFAKQHDGTSIGAKLTMSPTETCPFLGNTTGNTAASTESSSSSIIPIVIGAIVGLLVIALAVGVIVYCLKRKKKIEHNDTEKHGPPADTTANGHAPVEKMKVEDMDNPALTVHPERNTLTPLPKPDVNVPSPRVLPPINNHV